MRIKWLQLSDIHFNYKSYESSLLRMDFIRRLRSLAETESFTHLILSGDILQKNNSDPKEANKSIEFIKELINAIHVDLHNVILVPGNHDHDRIMTNNLTEDIYSVLEKSDEKVDNLEVSTIELLLKSFSNFSSIYKEIFFSEYYTDYNNPHLITVLDDLSIIRLNTAWLDVNSMDHAKLKCGRNQLLELLQSKEAFLKHTVNIAVGHHPIEDFSANDQKYILELFHRFNIGLYFCGHRHQSSIDYYQDKGLLQLTCPGAYNDGYSVGGYVYGVIDTDSDFYKAEFYKWDGDNWFVESSLKGTDSRGIYYFNTDKFKHNVKIAAVDFCIMSPHIQKQILAQSIGSEMFDTLSYPYSNVDIASIDWMLHRNQLKDFAMNIKHLIELGNAVHLYPLAPIPMLMLLGFEMQKNSHLRIHQFDRKLQSWVINENDEHIDYVINEICLEILIWF